MVVDFQSPVQIISNEIVATEIKLAALTAISKIYVSGIKRSFIGHVSPIVFTKNPLASEIRKTSRYRGMFVTRSAVKVGSGDHTQVSCVGPT